MILNIDDVISIGDLATWGGSGQESSRRSRGGFDRPDMGGMIDPSGREIFERIRAVILL